MFRRSFLSYLLTGAGIMVLSKEVGAVRLFGKKDDNKKASQGGEAYPFELTEQEWRERLTPEEYRVLREEGTERAFTSPLNDEKRAGVFVCAACGHVLFKAEHKYNSGTGWPSFYDVANKGAVGTEKDFKLFLPRTEVHCANCGGHLGHVFEDGPQPTGLRYCMNGVAMDFIPQNEMTKILDEAGADMSGQ